MMNLKWIREKASRNSYKYSHHGDKERAEDNLLLDEVEQALMTEEFSNNMKTRQEVRVV